MFPTAKTHITRHRYNCVGVVWRSVVNHFSNQYRMKEVVDAMFISATETTGKAAGAGGE